MSSAERWDAFFFDAACSVAEWHSKDPSTRVGALIARDSAPLSMGYNGPVRGYPDAASVFTDRNRKLAVTEHAERNALYNALSIGADVRGATMYVTHPPCKDCARGICQSGISRVVHGSSPDLEARWAESIAEATDILVTTGVVVERFDQSPEGPLGLIRREIISRGFDR